MDLTIIVATLEGCSFSQLDNPSEIERALRESVEAGGFTMLNQYVHKFEPQGVTGAAVLSESHLALHSWPEHGVLFIDIATCSGVGRTEAAFDRICQIFDHARIKRQDIGYRGPGRVSRTSSASASAPAPSLAH